MEGYIIIVLIFGILILLMLVALFFVNRLLNYKNRIENSFKTIKVCLEERVLLIDKVSDFIQKNLEHEENYVKKLEQLKETLLKVKADSDWKELKRSEQELKKFMNFDKVYPSLEKNALYEELKKEIKDNKDRIIYASESYDKGVLNYNNYRDKKVVSVISKIIKFPNYSYYNE